MFEQASRLKLRFDTARGMVTTEDLWDIPLINSGVCLDDIAKTLNKLVKESGEESFVVKKSRDNAVLTLKFDIVKHIIGVKLADIEAQEQATEVKAKKAHIMSIISDKQDDELKGKSVKSLKKMLDEL